MKQIQRIRNPYHNPFHNRFNVPVHSRLDEMQAYTHMVWLNEPAPVGEDKKKTPPSREWPGALAGAFALLLIVIFSATWLSN